MKHNYELWVSKPSIRCRTRHRERWVWVTGLVIIWGGPTDRWASERKEIKHVAAALPSQVHLGVIGLGYVGLPLAVSFAKHYPVTGFDINQRRVDELSEGIDRTLEVETEELRVATRLTFSTDPAPLEEVNVFVVTTPTPIDEHRQPDLGPLLSATRTVAGALRPGDIVIYESTVYPGATEEDCVPLLEELSDRLRTMRI